jgi:hypothetical protein
MKIIDIKSSTMGWNKYMKADKNKTNQLLLYKHFMAKQLEISEDKIDVEYLILKRRLYENMIYPQENRFIRKAMAIHSNHLAILKRLRN